MTPARRNLLWSAGVALAATLLLLANLGGGELQPHDEGLYGKFARNALDSGVWLYATEADGRLAAAFCKPPLTVWLVAGSFELLGPSLAALRLPFAGGALLCLAVCFVWGRRLGGPALGGLWALVLLLCDATLRWGRMACIEPLFVGFCLLGLSAYGRALDTQGRARVGAAALAGLGLALAAMTKQLAVGLAVLPILLLELARRDGWRASGTRLGLALGLPVLAVGAWFAAAYAALGPPLWRTYVESGVLERLRGYETAQHERSLNEVSGLLAHVFSPFAWILGAAGLLLWACAARLRERAGGDKPGELWLLVGFALAGVLLYENLSSTFLAWYLYALVPPLAGGVAWALASGLAVCSRLTTTDLPTRLAAVTGALALASAGLVALDPLVSQLDVAVLAALAAGLLLVRSAASGPPPWLARAAVLALALGLAAAAARFLRTPALSQEPGRFEQLMRELARRGAAAVAFDDELGLRSELWNTWFGPRAQKVRRAAWPKQSRAGFDARIGDFALPEEYTPPPGQELVRAPGAVAWIGDLRPPPWSPHELGRLLAAGPLTFEAEHMLGGRHDTTRREPDASGGRVRALWPWFGEELPRHTLVQGPDLAFPAGRYQLALRARWDCGRRTRRVGVLEVEAAGRKLGQREFTCTEGQGAPEWRELTLAVTLQDGDLLSLRAVHERGALAVDRLTVTR